MGVCSCSSKDQINDSKKKLNQSSTASEAPSAEPLLLEHYKSTFPSHNKKLEIIHFNDVYNIEERDDDGPIRAGVARFVSAFDSYKAKDKLVIFSGDLFFPSNLGTIFEGE